MGEGTPADAHTRLNEDEHERPGDDGWRATVLLSGSTGILGLMVLPDQLEDWTIEVVRGLATEGRGETDRYDFKAELQKVDHTKTCCAFANSRGGFLVFGVRQRGAAGWHVEGVPADREFTAKFGKGIRADPTIQYSTSLALPVEGNGGRVVYVVHVPRSPVRPHLPTAKDERYFWKRTNVGCEQMTLEEVRAEFMQYEERRERLKLLVVELATNLDIIAGYQTQEPQASFETLEREAGFEPATLSLGSLIT